MENKLIKSAVMHWKFKNEIEDIFLQCVEEFYKRAKVRYNWDEKTLRKKLKKLEQLKSIKFEKIEGGNKCLLVL